MILRPLLIRVSRTNVRFVHEIDLLTRYKELKAFQKAESFSNAVAEDYFVIKDCISEESVFRDLVHSIQVEFYQQCLSWGRTCHTTAYPSPCQHHHPASALAALHIGYPPSRFSFNNLGTPFRFDLSVSVTNVNENSFIITVARTETLSMSNHSIALLDFRVALLTELEKALNQGKN